MINLLIYLKDFKKEVILGPIFKLLEAIFELLVPLVMAKIIDVGVKNNDIDYILTMGGLLIILAIIGLCCAIVCQYFASKASQGFGTVLRNKLFEHINSLSHSELDEIGASSLITRLTNDINQIQVAVAMFIRLAFRAPFIIIGSAIMAMIIDIKLSSIFLISMPLIIIVLYLVMSKSVPFYKLIQEKLDHVSLIIQENLEGVRVIRAFSKEKNEVQRFSKHNCDLTNLSINVGKISSLLNPITYIIMNFSIVGILWFGGIRVNSGLLSQGEIIAFVNYMSQILLTLFVFANLIILFTKAAASASRVSEILDINSSIVDNNTDGSILTSTSTIPKVEFKNVYFKYNKSNKDVLNNISFKIMCGQTVGIIGGTGSGKTTLINLIPRFYDTSRGDILFDGINIKNYNLKSLRNRIGIVPQKSVLFSGTLRENMTLGNTTASDSIIRNALDIAQCSEFVNSLPNGYDTKILQGGKNLSGGQKQRLSIARALINNPELLILDDSSSALDFATDSKLRKALKENTKDMTVFIISQRATALKNCDKIIVLDNGKLVGIGTHNELLLSCNIYKEICSSQLSTEEAEI